ncbi:Carbohydrate esterase 4 protein, partial [Modicella reniformis]
HQIAAHPWSHRDFEDLSDNEIRGEMLKIEEAFRNIIGVVPRYMRPPYGEHSKRVRKIMEEMGYIMVLWDVDQVETTQPSSIESTSQTNSDFDTTTSASENADHKVDDGTDHGDDDNNDIEKQPMTEETQKVETKVVLEYSGHKHRSQSSFSSKWAEAVRGVPHLSLDRDAMVMSGIYQEATSVWAVEYVQSLGYEVMPVGTCLGETDPRLWYKDIREPADPSTLPQSCYF